MNSGLTDTRAAGLPPSGQSRSLHVNKLGVSLMVAVASDAKLVVSLERRVFIHSLFIHSSAHGM